MRIFTGATLFDGSRLRPGMAVLVADGRIAGIVPEADAPAGTRVVLAGGVLAPGMVDLQVNGGGGVMVDGATTAATLAAICEAHARLGATAVLPTLISDTPAATAAVIAAGIDAAAARRGGLSRPPPRRPPSRPPAQGGA